MQKNIIEWHNNMSDQFYELGFCYEEGSIPINPLVLSSTIMASIAMDLPKLAEVARKLAIAKYNNGDNQLIRDDYIEVISSYLNKERYPVIMRADGILVGDQLKLLELNIDSGVGGIWEVDFLQNFFSKNPKLVNVHDHRLINPKYIFLKLIKEVASLCVCDEQEINLAFVGNIDFDQYYKDQAHDICEWITSEIGVKAYFCFPENLRVESNYISDGNKSYHLIYRDSSLIHKKSKVAAMINLLKLAAETRSIVLSDPVDLLIEQKDILRFLHKESSKNDSLLNNDEKILVNKYVPATKSISDLKKIDKVGYLRKKQKRICHQKMLFSCWRARFYWGRNTG